MNPEIFEVPDYFLCPILQTILHDPVMTIDGHTFERKAITEWLQRGNQTNPLTNKKLQSLVLIPNLALKAAIEKFKQKMPPEMRNQVIHPVVVKPIKPISPLRRISPVRRFSPIRGISPLAKKEEVPKKVNYLIRSKDKKTLNLVLFGHLDCGKSTLLGHLLYKWGGNKKITLDQMKSVENLAFEMGKGSFKFAWLIDEKQEQRQRGITFSASLRQIETNSYMCNFIDTPGMNHFEKERAKYMNSGDAAILVIAASMGQFQAGISALGGTRSFSLIAFTMGIKQMIVVINKMDDRTVIYSQSRYKQVKDETGEFLKKVGFKVDKIHFIPVSAWNGENLTERSQNMPWYKGPTVMEAIDLLEIPKRQSEKPLRICVNEVYHKKGVLTGFVRTGQVHEGDNVVVTPGNLKGVVKSIQSFNFPMKQAECGDFIGIKLSDTRIPREIIPGCVIGSNRNDPPREVESFTAQIVILFLANEIYRGYEPTFYGHTARVPVKITQLISIIDRRTGKQLEKQPKRIKNEQSAVVEIMPLKPVYIAKFAQYPHFGRFYLRDNKQKVSAVGVVKNVVYKQFTKTKEK